MSRVFVCGIGAVSPAGWDVAALRQALEAGQPLPVQLVERPGWDKPLRARLVPAPAARLGFLAHPRLRRSSAITHYAAAAALEATAPLQKRTSDSGSLGILMCLQSGCVQYSFRFLKETLEDPVTASPLLFPETVFAAPASHLAALLGTVPLVHTLIGDPATYLQALALGAAWLEEERVDACLVVGAEETNWLRADALWHLEHAAIISGGAGAICLSRDPAKSIGVELKAVTEAQSYSAIVNRTSAAQSMRERLESQGAESDELLCDGLGDSPRTDAPEKAAWQNWKGPRVSPKRVLGEGLMAAAAWQCVAACDVLAQGDAAAANVSVVGCNQMAVGARFARAST